MQEEPTTHAVGTIIRDPDGDEYVIEGLLGRGGFGSVYLVRNRHFRRNLFALKEVMNPKKGEGERFLFEGEILKRLHHWALPHVYRVFEHNKLKRVYLLMDYVQGKNLETLRREQPEKRFPLPLVLTMMAPVVDALIYLHQQNPPIVHRDIKPANIIVTDKADETMLVDFGLAKEYVEENTTRVVRHGSPGYAAPEQYGSGTTPQTDIYSLGATFYTLLTGIVPIDAITRATRDRSNDPLVPAYLITSDVPAAIGRTLQRAMSIRVNDRFNTIEDFWQELTSCVSELQIPVPPMLSSFQAQPQFSFKQDVNTMPLKNQLYIHTPRLERQGVRPRVLPLIILALLLIGFIGTAFALYMQIFYSHPSPSTIYRSMPTATLTPGTTLPTPTTIASTYKGMLLDNTTGKNTTMALRGMRQNQDRISGYLLVGPNGPQIQGNGSLRGTIIGDQLQFVVTTAGGDSVLFFTGVMQSRNYLSGNFSTCSSAQDGNCRQIPGSYGTWNVNLAR